MYRFKENINTTNFFRFDKTLIGDLSWAMLPAASKSIYPVIGVHCNLQGVAFPSQNTISVLAGCTEKTVRAGIKGLMGFHGFKLGKTVTKTGRRKDVYYISPAPSKNGRAVFIYKAVFEGGNWRLLNPSAQALYPVMKCFSYFNGDEYSVRTEDGDEGYGYNVQTMIDDGAYHQRVFDFVDADIDVMAEFAGISITSTYSALQDLADKNLIEETDAIRDSRTWMIFRVPPKHFKRDYLNARLEGAKGSVISEITA